MEDTNNADTFFHYEFLQNAFISGILIGLIAPLLGVFIVVRRLSLIADALSHVSLAGIAASLYAGKQFAVLAGVSPIYFGMAFSVAGSLIIERLRTVYKHYQELAIPIIMSGESAFPLFSFRLRTDSIRICSAIYSAASALFRGKTCW